ncbi:hypothetical protein [Shinella sp. SUS2]|nr:hypothetical protein [Shinella sp. SUS2]
MTAVIFAFMAFHVFNAPMPSEMVQRAQAFAPFGLVLGAIVTFLTVGWRGVIAAEQLELQRQQITQFTRQNDAKDKEVLAKLVQDGAKLLEKNAGTAENLAGVASLETLLENKETAFHQTAMSLIGDFYIREWATETLAIDAAREALMRGADQGLVAKKSVKFDAEPLVRPVVWPAVRGFKEQTYLGGTMYPQSFAEVSRGLVAIHRAIVIGCSIRAEGSYFEGCSFFTCHFERVGSSMLGCEFDNCNFPGTVFDGKHAALLQLLVDDKIKRSFYYAGRPPKAREPIEWTLFLEERQPNRIPVAGSVEAEPTM